MEALLEIVLAWPAYWTGRLVLPVLTVGRMAAVRPSEEAMLNVMGIGRREDGTILLGGDLLLVVAVVVWAMIAAAVILFYELL